MPSTYTNLGIEQPATGEQIGTWGTTLNNNFDLFDHSISQSVTEVLPGTASVGTPNDMDVDDGATSSGRYALLILDDAGDLGNTAFVRITPDTAERIMWIRNNLTAARDVIVFQGTYDAGRDLTIPNGATMLVHFDGGGASNAYATSLFGVTGPLTATSITTDTIYEQTAAAGVTIDSVLLKDNGVTANTFVANTSVTTDTIYEKTSTAGVTIDSVLLKDNTVTGDTFTANTSVVTDTIDEKTGAAGVTIDSVLLKDNTVTASSVSTDVISEKTTAAGVTIDSVLLKDNGVTANTFTANTSVTTDTIYEKTGAAGVTIDSVLLKDNSVTALTLTANTSVVTDTISEKTTAAGVTIDSVLLKDNTVTATTLTANTSVVTDTISEKTGAAGVTIDSVLLKDNTVSATTVTATNVVANTAVQTDSIIEKTSAAGITVEGTLLKDSTIRLSEAESPISFASGKGDIYVRTATPNQLWFQSDDSQKWPIVGFSEQSWTPVVTDGTNDGTHSNQTGKYHVIGNICFFDLYVSLTSKASMSGVVTYIEGLPYSSTGNGGHINVCRCTNVTTTAGYSLTGFIASGTNRIQLQMWDSTSGLSSVAAADLTDSFTCWAFGWFLIDQSVLP